MPPPSSALALAGCATAGGSRQHACRRPASSAPTTPQVSESYIIGALDELTVFVWRNPELGAKVQVRPDGRITTPLITDMVAAGKTPAQLADDIRQALDPIYRRPAGLGDGRPSAGHLLRSRSASSARPRSRPSLPYRANMTLLDAMIAVGGLSEYAAGDRARLIRLDRATGQQTRI